MKILLKISLMLNLGLMVLLISVLGQRPEAANSAASAIPNEEKRQAVRATEPQLSSPPAVEAWHFTWSQLESTDYRAYIANLRGIGCPEQTIRDIITTDLDALYSSRREALQQKLSSAGPSISGRATRDGIENALEALRSEETATLAALLGPEPSSNQAAASTPAPPRAARRTPELAAVQLPLAFQQVDPGALKLSDRQVQAIGNLQQWFIDQLGGPDQDPNDPAYREHWLKAQPEIDDMMRGMIGINAFEDYQLAARASQR